MHCQCSCFNSLFKPLDTNYYKKIAMSQSNFSKPSAKNGSKVRRAKQGRLNVRNPTGPVAIYTEESESEVEQNENDNDDNHHDQVEEENNRSGHHSSK